jgi:phospholipase C
MANANLPPITNVVVLMLENRSFDNVVGTLYPRSASFEGLPLDESNQDAQGNTYTVANNPNSATVPPIDPGESFMDMNLQIFGNTAGTGSESMSGFVLDYLAGAGEFPAIPTTPTAWYAALPRTVAHSDPPISANGQDIMNYFNAAQMPVTWELAQAFGVSDSWFGSCPTQTSPNRLFLHCGSAGGYVDDYEYVEYMEHALAIPALPSVFELLDGGKGYNSANWKVYYHDISNAQLLIDYAFWAATGKDGCNVCSFDTNVVNNAPVITPTFLDDVQNGTLPKYAFIEPRYLNYPLNKPPLFANCNHPPNDVTYGEILLADVYNTIRASSYWKNGNILLIVTYDEHGGCYDHVPPPTNATPPGGQTLPTPPNYPYVYPFPATRFGPRVPALLISPYVPANTVFRPEGFIPNQPNNVPPYDHTSVIATLRDFFSIGSLTARDAAAPSLAPVLSLSSNLNYGPVSVTPPTPPSSAAAALPMPRQHPTHLSRMLAVMRELLRDKR